MQQFHINWNKVILYMQNNFYIEGNMDIIGIIYIIGIQELGKGTNILFNREDKVNILHIAVCRILEPFGYYSFVRRDKDGWPHYMLKKKIPFDQKKKLFLIKKAIIHYMSEENIL